MRFKLPLLIALIALTTAMYALAAPKPTPMRVACGLVLGEPLTLEDKMSRKGLSLFESAQNNDMLTLDVVLSDPKFSQSITVESLTPVFPRKEPKILFLAKITAPKGAIARLAAQENVHWLGQKYRDRALWSQMWKVADELATHYPHIEFTPDVLAQKIIASHDPKPPLRALPATFKGFQVLKAWRMAFTRKNYPEKRQQYRESSLLSVEIERDEESSETHANGHP